MKEKWETEAHKQSFWDEPSEKLTPPRIDDIYESPGHLIRRYQQISTSIFAEELGESGLTPVQYASLLAIRDQPGIDQRSLSRIIAIDRSTVGTVLKTLEAKGLILRTIPSENQRIKMGHCTEAGEALLQATRLAIADVQRRLLEPLSTEEQRAFLGLLSRLVQVNNIHSRAPLDLSRRSRKQT